MVSPTSITPAPLSSPDLCAACAQGSGDPVFQRRLCLTERLRRTGYPACTGYDPGNHMMTRNSTETSSAKPRTPLKHSIPEFPTKVGGHHMSGSTDPARDSSLKDR